jgi:hypothetical protein
MAQEVFSGIDLDSIVQEAEAFDQGLNRAEGMLKRRDGKEIILGISYAPLRDDQGTVHGLIFNFQDITTVRAMEAEIKRGEQLAGGRTSLSRHRARNSQSAGLEQWLHSAPALRTQAR